jgi:hypothetical protein
MAAWLIGAIEHLPPRARRIVVAASAVLLLAGAITLLTLEAGPRGNARWKPPTSPQRAQPAPPRLRPPPVSPPVLATDLHAARVVASLFLVSYLRLAYGAGSGASVRAVTPELRRQLITQPAQATPAERRRHPRMVSLVMVGTTPGFVVATATVRDGGIAAYRLRFTLREQTRRWLVSSVQEG